MAFVKHSVLSCAIAGGSLVATLSDAQALHEFGDNLSDVDPAWFTGLPPVDEPASAALPAKQTLGGVTAYTSREMFIADFPGLTFQSFASPTCSSLTGFPGPLNATRSNVCYTHGAILPGVTFRDDPPNNSGGGSPNGLVFFPVGVSGLSSSWVGANTYADRFVILFDPPVSSVGMDLATVYETYPLRIRVFNSNNGLMHEETLPSVGSAGAFYGVHATPKIAKIDLEANRDGGVAGAEGLTGIFYEGPRCNSTPQTIPDNFPSGVNSTIIVPDSFIITDVNVRLTATHSWVGDLKFTLQHEGVSVSFYDRPGVPPSKIGCPGDDLPGVWSDDEGGSGAWETGCTNTAPAFFPAGRYTGGPLSVFDWQNATGVWRLNVSDNAQGDTGTLRNWCLEFNTSTSPVIFKDGFEVP